MLKKKVIVVCGQTATGKSDLAVKIALNLKRQNINVEIISADSRQVYIGADMTSAKITQNEMCGIPHQMISITSFKKDYTVADYKKAATKIINKLHKQNIVPIICGGTGLYIDNVIYDNTIPIVLPNTELRVKLEKLNTQDLFNILKKKDPNRAKNIDSKNKRRIIRALEIIEVLGYVPQNETPILNYETLFIGLKLENEELKNRIAKRTNKRIRAGMVDEIIFLHNKEKLNYERISSFGMEFKWLSLFAENLINKSECVNGINKDSLAYAKRQLTWFKRNKDIHWLNPLNKAWLNKQAIKLVKDFINQ